MILLECLFIFDFLLMDIFLKKKSLVGIKRMLSFFVLSNEEEEGESELKGD